VSLKSMVGETGLIDAVVTKPKFGRLISYCTSNYTIVIKM